MKKSLPRKKIIATLKIAIKKNKKKAPANFPSRKKSGKILEQKKSKTKRR